MKKDRINAYLIRVDEVSGYSYKGYLAEMENDLKSKKLFVNYNQSHGKIQVLRLNEVLCAIINSNGRKKNFHVNRLWIDGAGVILDFIVGNIMCVRYGGNGEFTSVLPEDIPVIEELIIPVVKEKYMKEWHG